MSEHVSEIVHHVQQAASSKGAVLVGITGASVELWIENLVTDSLFQDCMILIGAMVPITIILINIVKLFGDYQTRDERKIIASAEAQTAIEEKRQAKIRTLLLEDQAREKGIKID